MNSVVRRAALWIRENPSEAAVGIVPAVVVLVFFVSVAGRHDSVGKARETRTATRPDASVPARPVMSDAEITRVISHGTGHEWATLSDRDRVRAGLRIEQIISGVDGFTIQQAVTRYYLDNSSGPGFRRRVADVAGLAAAMQ